PTTPPALEKVPTPNAPTPSAPNQSTPTLKNTGFGNPFVKPASAEMTAPPILILAPPANAPAAQIADSQTSAVTEPFLKQPKPLPPIKTAQPIPQKETAAKWQPPKYIPNAIAATALIKVEQRVDDTPLPAAHLEKDPSMSNRIEQHLL